MHFASLEVAMKNVLFAVLVFCVLLSCATTRTATLPSYPNLSQEDVGSFGPEERAVLSTTDGHSTETYPDAVVFVKSTHTSNPKTEEVSGRGELPPLRVSSKRSDKVVGQRIIISTDYRMVCVSGTEDCSRSIIEAVTVLRRKPLRPHTGGVNTGSVVHDRTLPRAARHAAMLDVTDRELLALIGHALDIRDGLKNPGQCDVQETNRFISAQEREPWRSNIIGTLSWNGYLTYGSLQVWMKAIVRYRFALNGCYAGAPNNQEAEALLRGEAVLSQIGIPIPNPFNPDKL